MNRNLLLDSLVRQSMVMIARLATTGGARSPLAHISNQVFLDLAKELRVHGLGQRVIADMFGITLRAYQMKVRRVSESATERGKSLWEAIVSYLDEKKRVSRFQVLKRFENDESAAVVGVLRDLVKSGLVYASGDGVTTMYRVAESDDAGEEGTERVTPFVWVTIHRAGQITRKNLRGQLPSVKDDDVDAAIEVLLDEGRIERCVIEGEPAFASSEFFTRISSPEGWEAAVFDHFQSVANAICAKADSGETRAEMADAIGGSTFHFNLSESHPLRAETLQFLERVRGQAFDLQRRIREHEQVHGDGESPLSVTFYFGQNVVIPNEPSESK